jgi:hypothetical protein
VSRAAIELAHGRFKREQRIHVRLQRGESFGKWAIRRFASAVSSYFRGHT